MWKIRVHDCKYITIWSALLSDICTIHLHMRILCTCSNKKLSSWYARRRENICILYTLIRRISIRWHSQYRRGKRSTLLWSTRRCQRWCCSRFLKVTNKLILKYILFSPHTPRIPTKMLIFFIFTRSYNYLLPYHWYFFILFYIYYLVTI